ncbi:MAG: lipase [Gammaproteobacteria bacterium]
MLRRYCISAILSIICLTAGAQTAPPVARFDPANGVLPTPNNLLFAGSVDGTLNIPVTDPSDPASATVQALNALDGFSTTGPMIATFSSALDPASLVAGVTVRLYEVELDNPVLNPGTDNPFAVTRVVQELSGEIDFTVNLLAADPAQRTVEILPLRPLKPKTGYMVALTDGIRGQVSATSAFPDLTYIFARYERGPLVNPDGSSRFANLSDAQAQALEPIRRLVVAQEQAAASAGLRKAHIVLSWSFMTESTGDALRAIRAGLTALPFTLAPTGLDTASVQGAGLADIYTGTLQLPYYLDAPTLIPTVILTTRWRGANETEITRYNPQPVAPQTLSVPVLASIPNATSGQSRPASGWPVVLFQHGITRNRTDLLAVADSLAAAGYAAVAIDLPLHGITDSGDPFYNATMERTFNLDLINNETGAPGPDGLIDPSGTHFLNLASLLTARDNLRQGVADLLQLAASLEQAGFDTNQVGFVGYSLGAIVGVPLLAVDDGLIGPASLVMPGGGIAKLLESSASFGPQIQASLAAAGLIPGTPAYESYFRAAQQVLDAGDAINYAQAAADKHPTHLIEIIGPPPDQTIPNSVPGAPLSGTEPLLQTMELSSAGTTQSDSNGLHVAVRFLSGAHSSLLDPGPDADVTAEIQQQIAGFIASAGTLLPIDNTSLVFQP